MPPLCGEIDLWTTTYLHALEGEDPVVEWMRGTGLRPYLDVLTDPALREAFLAAVRTGLAQALELFAAELQPRGVGELRHAQVAAHLHRLCDKTAATSGAGADAAGPTPRLGCPKLRLAAS